MRLNLVIVCAGDQSLHRQWLDPKSDRNWDLLVSYYGDQPDSVFSPDGEPIVQKGGKWECIARIIDQNPALLDRYKSFWLPDDDIAADQATINALFDVVAEFKLELAQPSLAPDSFYGWPIVLQCRGFRLRFTDFVELMVPCLSAQLLKRTIPLVHGFATGAGLDLVWARLMDDVRWRAAIIDELAVTHTRPFGSGLMPMLRIENRSKSREFQELHDRLAEQFGLHDDLLPFQPVSYGGVIGRSQISNRLAMAWLVWLGCLRTAPHTTDRPRAIRDAFNQARRALLVRPHLDPLGPSRAERKIQPD